MGHAGSTGSIALDVYSKTWWNDRVEAVSRVVEAVFAEPDEEGEKIASPQKGTPTVWLALIGNPFGEPQAIRLGQKSV